MSEYEMWAPTKPENLYEDSEIRETGPYQRLAPTGLPEPKLLSLTREAIRALWEVVQDSRYTATIAEVFSVLEADDIDHGNEVIITKTEDGVCKYRLSKIPGRKRFSHSNYQQFIGQGTPRGSELYQEAVGLLREKCGLDESALHGGFLLVKSQMRSDTRNGVFELVLGPGKANNSNTDLFSAKLYQFPFVAQAIPTIVFPPDSGEKGPNATLRVSDDEQEVPSMSQMLRSAIIKGGATPAVVFGLADMIKRDGNSVVAGYVEVAEVAEAAPASQEASMSSAAHALLDDDEEEEE